MNHQGTDSADYVDERYPLSALTARVIAAAQEVHRVLGPRFEEVVYQRASAKELPAHGVDFAREVWMNITYKAEKVGAKHVDFVVSDRSGSAMVEIKAKHALEEVDFVQALSYLKGSGFRVGLLLNFGSKHIEIKRLAN